MTKTTLLALCALPLVFAPAQAIELSVEPAASAYWEIPLSHSRSGKSQQAFGFRMDQIAHDSTGALVSSFAVASRKPVVDFRFNAEGMQGIYVRGVNMSPPTTMKLGVEETALWVLGGMAVGITAMIIEDVNDDDNNTACVTFTLNACLNRVACC